MFQGSCQPCISSFFGLIEEIPGISRLYKANWKYNYKTFSEENMLNKSYSKTRDYCRVTFKLSPDVKAQKASVCGEFNNWDRELNPMKRLKNGGFTLTLSLKSGQSYRFRYLLDGERWENDWEADSYVPNDFGSQDSVVEV
jgi:1,4-alpha-glucan branching enzyme